MAHHQAPSLPLTHPAGGDFAALEQVEHLLQLVLRLGHPWLLIRAGSADLAICGSRHAPVWPLPQPHHYALSRFLDLASAILRRLWPHECFINGPQH